MILPLYTSIVISNGKKKLQEEFSVQSFGRGMHPVSQIEKKRGIMSEVAMSRGQWKN